MPGARMLMLADGQTFGIVSGGCLEADVLERAKKVLATDAPPATQAIGPLAPESVPATTSMLARAFGDNPSYRAILPFLSDESRHRAVGRVKRGFVQAAVRHQIAAGIVHEGRVAAAMLVCAPGRYPVSWAEKVWQASGCASTGPRGARNFLAYDAFTSRRHLREPHFYLFVLGVDPDLQGRGLGKALLRSLSARADEARLPCFLETDRESSVTLYRSVGYEVVGDERCAKLGGLRVWFMKRAATRP